MSEKRLSPFGGEWRKCLEEHLKHTIRTNGSSVATTVAIMKDAGFREDDIQRLYIEATMLSQELPSDAPKYVYHPAECNCPSCVPDSVIEQGHDSDGQPLGEPSGTE